MTPRDFELKAKKIEQKDECSVNKNEEIKNLLFECLKKNGFGAGTDILEELWR